jgi:hypothetical protein
MSQVTPNPNPAKQPLVFVKIHGNQVDKLKKDEYIWHCQYENILRITVAFIPVEKADNKIEIDNYEKSTKIYLKNKGFNVKETKYYENADTLKQYLIMKK